MALTSACESDDSDAGAASLAGTSWQLSAWSASSSDPSDFNITANFDDASVGGRSAVNTYGADYTASSDGDLRITQIVSTQMAGSPEAMHAEELYFNLLGEVRSYRMTAETLIMTDAGGHDVLVFDRR